MKPLSCVSMYMQAHAYTYISYRQWWHAVRQLSAPLPLKKQTKMLWCVKPAGFCSAKHSHLCWFETPNLILPNVESGREHNWFSKSDGRQSQDAHTRVCVCCVSEANGISLTNCLGSPLLVCSSLERRIVTAYALTSQPIVCLQLQEAVSCWQGQSDSSFLWFPSWEFSASASLDALRRLLSPWDSRTWKYEGVLFHGATLN